MTPETKRNWSKFSNGFRGPQKSYIHISINKRGKIQLNSHLMDKLDFARAASLYYDRETSSIGIMPRKQENEDEDALPINMREGREYGEIYALSFLRCYNIKIRKTLATNHIETTPDGMLILDLRQAHEVVRNERASKAAKIPAKSGLYSPLEHRKLLSKVVVSDKQGTGQNTGQIIAT